MFHRSLLALEHSPGGKPVAGSSKPGQQDIASAMHDNDSSYTIFNRLVSQFLTSRADITTCLLLLYHCLHEGNAEISRQRRQLRGMNEQTEHNQQAIWRIPGQSTAALSSSNAMIRIRDASSGQDIKMTCPPILVIEFHSAKLAEMIKKVSLDPLNLFV